MAAVYGAVGPLQLSAKCCPVSLSALNFNPRLFSQSPGYRKACQFRHALQIGTHRLAPNANRGAAPALLWKSGRAIQPVAAHRDARQWSNFGGQTASMPQDANTLEMLEWSKLSSHVANFCSIDLSRDVVMGIPVSLKGEVLFPSHGSSEGLQQPRTRAESEYLLSETQAAYDLQDRFGRGVAAEGAEGRLVLDAAARLRRGATLSVKELFAVSRLLENVTEAKARFAGVDKGYTSGALRPLAVILDGMPDLPTVRKAIGRAIDENGLLCDNASDGLRKARLQYRTLANRCREQLNGILRQFGVSNGVVTEFGARLCLELPSQVAANIPGILLRTGGRGSGALIEPSATVPFNARLEEAFKQVELEEELVCSRLSAQVAEEVDDLIASLVGAVRLDVITARARYSKWLDGYCPRFWPPLPSTPGVVDASGNVTADSDSSWSSDHAAGMDSWGSHASHDKPGTHAVHSSAAATEDRGFGVTTEKTIGQGREGSGGLEGLEDENEKFIILPGFRHPLLVERARRESRAAAAAAAAKAVEERVAATQGLSVAAKLSALQRSRQLEAAADASSGGGTGEDDLDGADSRANSAPGTANQPPGGVVPVDLVLARRTKVLVVTGPNTGGKTALLKSVGLAVAMAKAGLFLPTQGAALIPWVDSVLADIGDSQSLAENLSTFSGHMANIKKISEIATPQSLVLLDELGAGTDPTEGAALGMSLLRYFSGVAGLTLATTHHSELKTLKINDPRFENAGVEFNEASLQPTYKVFVGIPGRSNALNISEKLGLDARVLASARAIYGTVEAQVDDLIAELEDAKKLNNEYLAQEAALQRQARSLRAKLAVLTSAESAQREEMMRKQRDAINVAIQEGRSKVTEIVREVQARGSQATAGSSLNVGRGQGAGVSGGRLVQGLPQPAGPAGT
eukprot:jgi/Mesvir1/16525/Mv10073-RA.3